MKRKSSQTRAFLSVTLPRAEGYGTVASEDLGGYYPELRGDEAIERSIKGNAIFNLGVTSGIRALLTQLHAEGFTITSPTGECIGNGCDLGELYEECLRNPKPPLRSVK